MVQEYIDAMREAGKLITAAGEMKIAARRKLIDYCEAGVANIDNVYLGEFDRNKYEKRDDKVYWITPYAKERREINETGIPWDGFLETDLIRVASEIEREQGRT